MIPVILLAVMLVAGAVVFKHFWLGLVIFVLALVGILIKFVLP